MATRSKLFLALSVLFALVLSACNLSGAPSEEQIAQTATAALTQPPSRTPIGTSGVPTTIPLTQQTASFPTSVVFPTQAFPTAIVVVPTRVVFPTSQPPPFFPSATPFPVSIVILSPVPGNVVAGNVQILGSAVHPQFLQYQVEFGPDPNAANLWYPATSAMGAPIVNGLLGIWNTTSIPDGRYQLRLRVYLRDGTLLTTVVNNITVQNRINTPIPSPTQNIPRPIAAFTQDKASGDVPLTVRFTNQSFGTINTVSWNFGDGNTSSEVNPAHTFGTPGLYNVTLTVTGPGGSSNVARQINVTSPTAPVAGFTQDKLGGLTPLVVQFTDQSTGNITAWNWNFSDGSTTSQQNPSHTFVAPGTYNVFLTVSGPGGSSSVTRQIVVTSAIPPTLTPSLTYTPTQTWTNTLTPTLTPSLTLTFTETSTVIPIDTSTFTPTTTPVPPTATFTETPVPPTATFTTTPVPPTATFTPTELPPAPQANFSATAGNPLTIQFTNQSTGQNLTPVWDFGDGSEVTSEPNPQHTYAAGGSYTVNLIVTDDLGRSSTFSATLNLNQPGNADFTFAATALTVQFTSTSTGSVVSYLWDFGDSTSTSAEQNPQHAYATPGTYTVTLTITDANGATDSGSQQVTVNAPLAASFTATPTNLTVQFNSSASTGAIAGYIWDFGDGSGSNDANPSHPYAAAGTYNVSLIVTDNQGNQSAPAQQQVTVNAPLAANFTAQATELVVQFTSTSTGPVTGYAWDFGDGSGSSEQNPQHTYASSGTYVISLTVSDNQSNQSAPFQQQLAVVATLKAGFTFTAADLAVQFTSTSTGPITSYAWEFGDGVGNSNEQNPTHTYAAPGTYTVILTVSDNIGNSNSAQQQVTVTAALAASFTATPSDLTVQFDSSASTGAIAGYIWDFGDGSGSNDANPSHPYAAAGTYNVSLIVTDNQGNQSAPAQQQVTVTAALATNFTASPTDLNVQFTSTSTGSVTGYVWDFGDGSGSNDQNPLHTYAAAGTYTVTLTVSDNQGNQSAPTQQQVTVNAALAANFTAQATDLTVQFDSSTSTGAVAGYVWDFGDGTPGTNDANPQHAYASAGTYNVSLVVMDNQGNQSAPFQQQVTVNAALAASFTATPSDLTVQFDSTTSTGAIAGYIWDFGDGSGSNDANPSHPYAAAGTYNVSLIVTDNQGNQSAPAQQQVTVTAAVQPQTQTLVDTTPILPDFNALQSVLRGIYANGVNSMGTQAAVFAQAGDSIFTQPGVLDPFVPGGQYDLSNNTDLQPIIDWFNSADLGGVTSFSRNSLAVNPGFMARDLLDPSRGDASCNGEAPLACELHQIHPVLMFVSIGANDAANNTTVGEFQNELSQIVSTITSNGTIPVLLTIPDDGSNPNTAAINDAIITVAQQNNVPVLNAARALNELASENLQTSPSGAGALDGSSVTSYGINALNLDLLQVLRDARNIIFPDA